MYIAIKFFPLRPVFPPGFSPPCTPFYALFYIPLYVFFFFFFFFGVAGGGENLYMPQVQEAPTVTVGGGFSMGFMRGGEVEEVGIEVLLCALRDRMPEIITLFVG